MRERLLAIQRAAKAADPFDIGWSLLGYYMLLVACTDCLMWFQSGSLAGYSWQSLVVYSLMSYPLWMLIGMKGVAREQVDMMENARWQAVDLFPGGATAVFFGHYIGKVIKTKALYAWLIAYIALAFYHGAGIVTLLLALGNLVFGASNLAIFGITAKMFSPIGYTNVFGSIFNNMTWILSGAVFPLGMISKSPLFYLLNPFSAAVSTPLSLLQNETEHVLSMQGYSFASSLIWCLLLFFLASRAERSQRARIYG